MLSICPGPPESSRRACSKGKLFADVKKMKIDEKIGKLSNFKPPFVWNKSNNDYKDTVKKPAVTNDYAM